MKVGVVGLKSRCVGNNVLCMNNCATTQTGTISKSAPNPVKRGVWSVLHISNRSPPNYFRIVDATCTSRLSKTRIRVEPHVFLQCLGQFVAVTLPSQADAVLVSFEYNTIGNDERCRRRSPECCISNGFGSFSRLRALCRPPLLDHALTINYRTDKYSHPVTAPRAPGLRLRCGKPGHAPEWRGVGAR